MQFTTTEISKGFNIPERDVRIIFDVVEHFEHEGYAKLVIHLLKIFLEDIKPLHYIVLGHLIGYRHATEKERVKINKSLSLCLRQN
jgi:hypothetical protein